MTVTSLKRGSMWQHVRTRQCYQIVGVAVCATNGEEEKCAVVYSREGGGIFCRDVPEFLDGRFVLVS